MFIGSRYLKDLLKEYEIDSRISTTERCIVGVEYLKQAIRPYYQHILYIADDPEELKGLEPVNDMFLLVFNQGKTDIEGLIRDYAALVNVLEVFSDDRDTITARIRDAVISKVGVGLLAGDILDYLYDNSQIQEMVDDFSKAFNNPIFVFDAGHTIIAGNWEMAEANEITKRLAENRRVTDFEYDVIYGKAVDHTKLLESTKPIEILHPEFGHKQLVCPIDPNRNMGVISIAELNRPFEQQDYALLEMFRDGVLQKMRIDEFTKNNRGFPYEYFIRDLLDRKLTPSRQFDWQFDYVSREFSEHMFCMVIETARSHGLVNSAFVREEIERLAAGTRTLMYKGEIIAIFCQKNSQAFPKDLFCSLQTYCEDRKLFAGLSNHFSSLQDIYDYYKQALRALEIGTSNHSVPGLYRYENNSLLHLENVFLQNENQEVYCHPKLKQLLEYDKENHTEFAETLYVYLKHERSNTLAAKELFIHKNTLVYRLQKIGEIVDIHYDDYQERMYLILSYELHKAAGE